MPQEMKNFQISNARMRMLADTADEAISTRYAVREVVGVVHSETELERVIDDLLVQGFDRSQISVMGDKASIKGTIASIEDDPCTALGSRMSSSSRAELGAAAVGLPFFIAGVGTYAIVVASGGTLAFSLAALLLAGATGGGVGALIAHTIGRRHQASITRQLEAGGLVFWIAVRNSKQERTALELLHANSATDVHVHEIERSWGVKDVPFYNAQPDPFLENEHRNGM